MLASIVREINIFVSYLTERKLALFQKLAFNILYLIFYLAHLVFLIIIVEVISL